MYYNYKKLEAKLGVSAEWLHADMSLGRDDIYKVNLII